MLTLWLRCMKLQNTHPIICLLISNMQRRCTCTYPAIDRMSSVWGGWCSLYMPIQAYLSLTFEYNSWHKVWLHLQMTYIFTWKCRLRWNDSNIYEQSLLIFIPSEWNSISKIRHQNRNVSEMRELFSASNYKMGANSKCKPQRLDMLKDHKLKATILRYALNAVEILINVHKILLTPNNWNVLIYEEKKIPR